MYPIRGRQGSGLMANVDHENMGRMESHRLTSTTHIKVCLIRMYMSGRMGYASIPVGQFHGRCINAPESENDF